MIDQKSLCENFEKAMLAIQTACQAEKDMLLEIVGGSIDSVVIDDEVRYTEKYWRTKTALRENSTLIVT